MMRMLKCLVVLSSAFGSFIVPSAFAALVVTNPPAVSTTIAAGDDFATQAIGNAWNMDNATDFDIGESGGFSSQTIASGLYSSVIAQTSGGGVRANFQPLSQGWGSNTVPHWIGEFYPIDTSHYHNFTIKLRNSGGAGKEPIRVVFFRDGDSPSDGSYGSSVFVYVTQQGTWNIVSYNLLTDTYGPPQGYHLWTEYPLIHGLRVDLLTDTSVNNAGSALGPNLEVAWIRMSAPSPYTVTWTDSPVGTYLVTAIDSDGARLQLNKTAVAGTSYAADLAVLAPGDYHIEVKNVGTAATSTSGPIHINAPPQIQFTAPTVRGEQSQSYAMTTYGHQWGPLSSPDISQVGGFSSYSFPPPGNFYGRPNSNDTRLYFNVASNSLIDTDLFRSACVTFEVYGPRDVGAGSVTRFFWSLANPNLSTTNPIVPYNSSVPSEYCFEDLKQVGLDPGSPPNPWAGLIDTFRFDPDELPVPGTCSTPATCRDVQVNSLFLSPFATANPAYTIAWTLSDADSRGTGGGKLLLNTSRSADLTQSIPIVTLPYIAGAHEYRFVTNHSIPNGTYYVGIQANDGLNSVLQYAGGPIVVNSADVIFNNGFDQ